MGFIFHVDPQTAKPAVEKRKTRLGGRLQKLKKRSLIVLGILGIGFLVITAAHGLGIVEFWGYHPIPEKVVTQAAKTTLQDTDCIRVTIPYEPNLGSRLLGFSSYEITYYRLWFRKHSTTKWYSQDFRQCVALPRERRWRHLEWEVFSPFLHFQWAQHQRNANGND